MLFARPGFIVLGVLGIAVAASRLVAQDRSSISRDIDALVQKRLLQEKIPSSPITSDADFLRRIYLDLIGRIPTMDQALTFLNSTEPDKRSKLIDDLLARPEFGVYTATLWRERIIDRSEDHRNIRAFRAPAFVEWMAGELNKDIGWDRIVSDMLTAEGPVKDRPAGIFIMANRVNQFPRPEDLTATTGRLFMGMHLRCAQCHDHPYVDTWSQDDFWQMAAFFGQLRDHGLEPTREGDQPVYVERPNPDINRERQYTNRMLQLGQIPSQKGPNIAIPRGSNPKDIKKHVSAKFFLGETPQLDEAPYRPTLAKWLTAKENPYFSRATVNRIWSHFFARGLVNPVDDMGPHRQPSHPELLDLLEKEFKDSGFRYKSLVRAICNSETYQRTSKPLPGNVNDQTLYSHMPIRVLDPDQMLDSLAMAFSRPILLKGAGRDLANGIWATRSVDDPATDYSHGIPQFLQMMNGSLGSNFLLPKQTAGKQKDVVITILYLSALSRRPEPDEMARMLAYLDRAFDPKQGGILRGYSDIYWVLVNSAEFTFNR